MKRDPVSGFTFLELLIVSAILSVVSLAIFASLNSGIKIWQKVNTQLFEEDVDIFFDKFARDLRNSLEFTGINFSGEDEQMEFAAVGYNPKLKITTVGRVVYFYNPDKGTLERQQKGFIESFFDSTEMTAQLLKDIKSLKFKYYQFDEKKKDYLWQEAYQAGRPLPAAVRIEIMFEDRPQDEIFTKTVDIPAHS